jgi:thiamine biosynthesis lipoprotein
MRLARFPFRAMGSPCELELYVEPAANAGAAAEEVDNVARVAIEEVARLEQKYSRFLPDSVTTRINDAAGSAEAMRVDDETAALLDYANTGFELSGGSFDITSGVLRRVWDWRSGRLPSARSIRRVLGLVGWPRIEWRRPWLRLPVAGMELDFGGYVKEYAVDRVAVLCRELGVRHGLVDLGGDIAIVGPNPDGSPWRIGIRNPRAPESAIARIDLAEGAIASSGDYERFMFVDGVRYSHILDPRTGWPVSGLASVSVTAPHCVVAGTATTIAMLSGRGGEAFLASLGLPYLCIAAEDEHEGCGPAKLSVSGSLAPPPGEHYSMANSFSAANTVMRGFQSAPSS